jgi:chromosome partitioning protein
VEDDRVQSDSDFTATPYLDSSISMNVVVANLKGGVGKTTTAVYLSAVAVAKGYDPVLLIDADRQASSAEWLEERPIEGVTVVEAPSERTLARAMSRHEGMAIVDTPPGDERLVQSAINSADAVVIPTRAGGVEYPRVVVTLGMISARTPRGVLIAAARLGTNDLDETIAWWKGENVPVWGVIPERVGIAAGPEARLYRQGLHEYEAVLRRALRKR